jgi:hypothetical protein
MGGYQGPVFTEPVDLNKVGADPKGFDFSYLGGGGGGGGDSDYDPDRFMREYYAGVEAKRRMNAIAAMRGLMDQLGLGSLMGKITEYVQDGYDGDAIMALIRTTPEYAARFPAMKALAAKGRAISEAEYIEYESAAATFERQYGLPAGMLGKESVTRLLEKEVSARELEERILMAAGGAFQTAPEVQQAFQEYYGIGPGGLTAYFLDPDVATPLLNKQYASSRIGGEAQRQGIGIDRQLAEALQVGGVTADEARGGFQKVASMAGLTSGPGESVSQRQLIGATLQEDVAAANAIERVSMSRAGAFAGGGGFATNQSGANALRGAAT